MGGEHVECRRARRERERERCWAGASRSARDSSGLQLGVSALRVARSDGSGAHTQLIKGLLSAVCVTAEQGFIPQLCHPKYHT